MKEKTRRGAGREILVNSARHLFMKNGTANVGINDVTADAGLAKMTLYNNFSSKDALIAEVYQLIAQDILASCRQKISGRVSEQEKIISLFEDAVDQKDYQRGCPMIHAVFQSADPDSEIFYIVQKYKRELRTVILDCLSAERVNRQQLADQFLLLLDGFALQQYLHAVDSPLESAKGLIQNILDVKN